MPDVTYPFASNAKKSMAVLQAVTRNRTGAVLEISEYVWRYEGNILNAYAVRLRRSMFTVCMLFEAENDAITKMAGTVAADLIAYSPKIVPVDEVKRPQLLDAMGYRIRVLSCDQSGIVKDTTAVLAKEGFDVVKLAGSQYPAPHSGTPLFCLDVLAEAPSREAADRAKMFLTKLARHSGWELDFEIDQGADETDDNAKFPPIRAIHKVRTRRDQGRIPRRRNNSK